MFLTVLLIGAVSVIAGFFLKDVMFPEKEDLETMQNDGVIPDETEPDENAGNHEEIIMPPPVKVKGIYVTGWVAGNTDRIDKYIKLCETTEINALVIDIKDDRGQVTFRSDMVKDSEASTNIIKNPRETVSLLKSNGIYAIARIVCFKDPIWSSENPELAIKNKNGNLWKDANGNTWLNPYDTDAWDYIISIAREAAKLGFDEVQFDYVRFPTDGNIREINYGGIADEKTKTTAIGEFLEYARRELRNDKIYVSADVFGIIAVSETDSEAIGQNLAIMAQNADSICPMVYPSHYANKRQNGLGQTINGVLFEIPDKQPYEVIYNTMLLIKSRVGYLRDGASVRPYLQDFTAAYLGAGYYQSYTAKQVREQIQAVYDAGFEEWILWNASSAYTEAAFE